MLHPLSKCNLQLPCEYVQPVMQQKSSVAPISPMKGSELRAQLRMQPSRNSHATSEMQKATEVASVADTRAHYRWLVTISAGGAFEVCCLPETTAAEMAQLYPRAELRPLPDAADEAAAILNERASDRETTEA
jgi:hypothetical protein